MEWEGGGGGVHSNWLVYDTLTHHLYRVLKGGYQMQNANAELSKLIGLEQYHMFSVAFLFCICKLTTNLQSTGPTTRSQS